MKRSYINARIREVKEFAEKNNYILPPFAYWTTEEWKTKGHEYDGIRRCGLGWDVTDFGVGNYEETGLLCFTIRNGVEGSSEDFKTYAEKMLFVKENQVTPMHFHYSKMEDIINRGKENTLAVKVYNSTKDYGLDTESPVTIYSDGRVYTVPAGDLVKLGPGESITIQQYMYHSFWAEGGPALIGEVSKVNDDNVDNHFLEVPERYPEITEDEAPVHYLCNEYPAAE